MSVNNVCFWVNVMRTYVLPAILLASLSCNGQNREPVGKEGGEQNSDADSTSVVAIKGTLCKREFAPNQSYFRISFSEFLTLTVRFPKWKSKSGFPKILD